MTNHDNAELERRFRERGIPLSRLYPMWYRLLKRLGFALEPPALLTLAQHYLYEGPIIGAVALVALADALFLSSIRIEALFPFVLLIVAIPLWNWWRYRRLLRRIGY